MGFVPNVADAGFTDQARLDSVDFDILLSGIEGDGVASGCGVTAQGTPDMTLAVAAGVVVIASTSVTVTGGNVTITTAHATNPRFDLVVVNNAGTKSVTAGTAAVTPVFPAIPANSVVLAAVYVPANDTAINTNQITDKRVSVPEPIVGAGWTTVSKATDETRNSTSTLAVDSTLKFTMAASTEYRVRLCVVCSSSATPDFKYGYTGPASPTLVVFSRRHQADLGTLNESNDDVAVGYETTGRGITFGTDAVVWLDGVVHNGSNAGDFEFTWAQGTSDAADTIVRAGSYLEYSVA